MDRNERREYLATLAATPQKLRAALKGLRKQDLTWTPAPGKWSILAIVCHLRDMERDAYLARYHRLLAEDEPHLPDLNGDELALERDYRSAKLMDVLREWRAARRESLKLLRAVKSEQWPRAGVHATAGPLTLETLLRRHALGNDEAPVAQIVAIRARLQVLARLESGPGALAAALRGLPGDALRGRPRPDAWGPLEIACHLRDIEAVFTERFARVAFSERPHFWMLDNERAAEVLRYRASALAEVLAEFRRRRGETLLLLRALPHVIWQRTGQHPKRGELTLEALALHLADHDARHLARLRELRAGV